MSNEINIEGFVNATLNKARTSAQIDTMRASGKTDTEIAQVVLSDITSADKMDMFILMRLINIHNRMIGEDVGLDITFAGHYRLMSHQYQHPDAVR